MLYCLSLGSLLTMPKTQLSSREDIATLVAKFYAAARQDELLGPIFNKAISNWPAHLDTITDFWEGNLLFTKAYHGDPLAAHAKMDAANNHTIDSVHFGVWLTLWFKTIDDNFTGHVAEKAKRQARKMSTFLHLHIFKMRPDN